MANSIVHPIPKQSKSKAAIFDAFLSLLMETGFENISATDIIERSNYSRSAFYSSFTDKYDLLEKLIDYQLELYFHSSYDVYIVNGSQIKDMYLPMLSTLTYSYENRRFLHLLFNNKLPGHDAITFAKRSSLMFNRTTSVSFDQTCTDIDMEMYSFVANQRIIAFSVYWDMHNWKYSPEYMATKATQIVAPISRVKITSDGRINIVK